MFITAFYAAATWLQSWRLSSLKSKIIHLTSQNGSIVLYKVPDITSDIEGGASISQVPGLSSVLCENVDAAKLGDLLWHVGYKRLCSVFPKQTIAATKWIKFSNDGGQFPLSLKSGRTLNLSDDKLHILIEADFQENSDAVVQCLSNSEFCQLENYGILRAWKAGKLFALLLESDVEHLTTLGVHFMQNTLSLEDGMEILRIETVDVHGEPCPLLNSDSIPVPRSIYQTDNINSVAEEDIIGIAQPVAAWLLMSPIQYKTHVELLRNFSTAVENGVNDTNIGLIMGSDKKPNLIKIDTPPTPPSSPQNGETFNFTNDRIEKSHGVKSSGVTSHSESYYSCTSQDLNKLSASLEQLSKVLGTISDEKTNGFDEDKIEVPIVKVSSEEVINHSPSVENLTSYKKLSPLKCSTMSLPTSVTPKPRSPNSPIKVPNILVLCDNKIKQDNITSLLKQILKRYRYTVYNVNQEQIKTHTWQKTTALIVLSGVIPASVISYLISYATSGGKIVSLCSDFITSIFPSIVLPDENNIMTFNYQKWNNTKLLLSLPSKISDINNTAEVKDKQGNSYKIETDIIGKESSKNCPVIILGKVKPSGGKILFSQAHFEIDPHQYETDKNTLKILNDNNKTRTDIMRDILSTQLGIECSSEQVEIAITEGYFLGRHELKGEFLKSIKSYLNSDGNILKLDNIELKFIGKGLKVTEITANNIPVMLYNCPPHFNTVTYFDNLKTESLGRLVIYADVMTSAMEFLKGPSLYHGLAIVPRQQINGKGRGGNSWLSPDGCGMFAIQIILPLNSNLGRRISLIQHITGLAVVLAIREAAGYEDIDLRLKWPNDIYAGDWAKLGGLIVTSSVMNDKVCCNIGCGFNLSNSEPTTCIQDLLNENGSKAQPLSLEKYLALTFTKLESLIESAQSSEDELNEILNVYCAYWLHSNTEVTVINENGTEIKATVIGLDDFGFLKVQDKNDKMFTVHPDGNSFDMLQGLIRPKI